MKILFIGDVVARPGRRAIFSKLAELKRTYRIDIAIMNAENLAGGFSVTQPIADELFSAGIDLMTSGNHIFDKKEAVDYINRTPRLIRPANYPPGTPGNGSFCDTVNGYGIAVINLLGRVFMPPVDDPFRTVDGWLDEIPEEVVIRIVDMHCEATSEKYAMGWHLDGRVSAVLGTHTHVPTADERILDNGTAYLTDIGMTGSYAGVIGMKKEDVLDRFTKMPAGRASHSKGDVWICAAVLDIDENTGQARSIERIREDSY